MAWELGAMGAALLAALSIGAYTLRTGISPMPSGPRACRALLAALPARVDGTVYELGAGWGTLALPLARRYPRQPVVAFELSPLPWLVCWLRGRLAGATNLRVLRVDFLGEELSAGGLLTCYLYPEGMARLAPKLAVELRPGAWVLSNSFALPGWQARAVLPSGGLWGERIYVYVREDPAAAQEG